jgi:hypothetical protein
LAYPKRPTVQRSGLDADTPRGSPDPGLPGKDDPGVGAPPSPSPNELVGVSASATRGTLKSVRASKFAWKGPHGLGDPYSDMNASSIAPGRRLRFAVFIVAIVVVVDGCGAIVGSTSDRVGDEDGASVKGAQRLSLEGVTISVPEGWGSESFVNASGMSVFRVGSFAFPDRPDDDVGQIARAAMAADDVLINIVDVTRTDPGETNSYYRPLTSRLLIEAGDATGQEGYTVPAVIRGLRLNGHNLYLSVAFGQAPPSSAQVASANAVLETLSAE